MRLQVLAVPFTVFLLAACSTTDATRVDLIGELAELMSLAGEWRGTYESIATGRYGSIVFHLTDDPDGSHGDVLMVPAARASSGDPAGVAPRTRAKPISIRFVRLEGRQISGVMEPYTLPGSDELLEARFNGTVDGDRASGSFETTGSVSPVRGTWSVRRGSAR